MVASRLTSKGQITIPVEVRKAMGLQTGDRVSFLVRDDGVVEMRAESVDIEELFGILKAQKALSLDEMNDAIARGVEEA